MTAPASGKTSGARRPPNAGYVRDNDSATDASVPPDADVAPGVT
jgi:hypothetical protein